MAVIKSFVKTILQHRKQSNPTRALTIIEKVDYKEDTCQLMEEKEDRCIYKLDPWCGRSMVLKVIQK